MRFRGGQHPVGKGVMAIEQITLFVSGAMFVISLLALILKIIDYRTKK